jgi:hypothetical protein
MASNIIRDKKNESWENAKDAGREALSKGKEAGEQATQAARQEGQDMVDKAKDAGAQVMDKVRDAGGQVMDKAKETAQSVGTMASETACMVGKKAEDATAAAGHSIAEFGDKISEKAPQAGFAGAAAQKVGETIKEGGRYIEEHKLSGMAHDVEAIIKNHPIPALLAVFGIGFMIGHAMKESR